jgi:hypothetical protein
MRPSSKTCKVVLLPLFLNGQRRGRHSVKLAIQGWEHEFFKKDIFMEFTEV